MQKEIRKIKTRGKANYIREIGKRGKITITINEAGYLCYDPQELANYQKKVHRGRPPKIKKENEEK